jgi:hypothetical protein
MRNFSPSPELYMFAHIYIGNKEVSGTRRTMTDFTMSNVITARRPRLSAGLWILTLSAAAAFVLLSIRYFMPDGASLQGRGALLVVISTGLLAGAGPLMGLIVLPHRLFLLLNFLVILDILCTGFLTYFIPAHVPFALMVVAAFGWFAHPGPGPRR